MASTIKIKNSSTTGAVPTASDLVQGELAVNVTDLGLYTENASGTVVKLNAPSIDDRGTGATKRMTIDTSGNVGVGVVPSSWASTYKGIQVNVASISNGSGNTQFADNWYNNSGDKYIGNGYASMYRQSDGIHKWFYAGNNVSGAGASVSFTQAMTLDASGRLGVGSTSPSAKLTLKNPSSSSEQIIANIESASSSSVIGRLTYDQTNDIMRLVNMSSYSGAGLRFGVNGLDQVNIDLSGNLLVGKTGSAEAGVGLVLAPSGYARFTSSGTSASTVIQFNNNNGTVVGRIETSGSTTSYITSSDYRLKEVSGILSGYKERLLALQPKQGVWKIDGAAFRGFLAHEFAESYPSSVSGEKDAVDGQGNPQYQGIQAGSSEVIADLVAYIQNLETRLAALEQQA